MTINQNSYNDIKKPIADKIPTVENEKATDIFINTLSDRLMSIADSIEDSGSLDICKTTLLYNPVSNPDAGSHVNIHTPADNKSNNKLNTQISALNNMLLKNKTTNSCFASEQDSYELIATTLIERAGEITEWLQNDYQDKHNIVMTTKAINNISQKQYSNLGYGFTKDSRGHIDAFESQVMTVVLRKNEYDENNPLGFNGLGFHVYTAYPGQRQENLNKELCGIKILPEEDVSKIIKETLYYKNATNMNKTALWMQATKKPVIPDRISLYHDSHKDAIVICGPEFRNSNNNNLKFQKRYFIQKVDNNSQKTVVSAALYAKDAYDTEANWRYNKTLKYPDNVSKDMRTYIDRTQERIGNCLKDIETKRIQQNETVKENDRKAEEVKEKAKTEAATDKDTKNTPK